MQRRQLSYTELLRRLITSGDLNNEEAWIATGILTLRESNEVGWRTMALLERLVGRGFLRPLPCLPGDTPDLVRYMDSSGDHYVLCVPGVERAESGPLPPPPTDWKARVIGDMEKIDDANRGGGPGSMASMALVLVDLDRWPERADATVRRQDLEQMTRVLQEHIRGVDWFQQIQEGHFVAVLHSREAEAIDEETVRGRAEVLKRNVRLSAGHEGSTRKRTRGPSVSIGFVIYPHDSKQRTFLEILDCARGALRSAQEGGGDQVVSCREFRSEL